MGDDIVRLRSSDGLLFESSARIVSVSPIIAELRDLDDADDEVPLPMVSGSVLAQILDFCERYAEQGQWDTSLLHTISKNHSQLEQLTWAADFLCLEQLMERCLGKLAHIVKEQGPQNTSVSVTTMRRALRFRSGHLPSETIAAVLEALGLHAHRGDLDSVAAVRLYLDRPSPIVRKAAIAALGRLAMIEDVTSISCLEKHVADNQTDVQLVALVAIAQLAARGNELVIDIMKQKCLDGDAPTRGAAVAALGRVAVRGAAQTTAIVKHALVDANSHVRKVAVEAFAQLVQQGDKLATLDVIKCLEDMDESVRQAAIQAVGMLIEMDIANDTAIKALLGKLDHRYWWVSWAASKVLVESVPKDEPNVVDAYVRRLGHDLPSTRQVAWQMLPQVASKGNVRAIEGLKDHLQHSDGAVRQAAVKALAMFGTGEESAIKVASELLGHPRHRVRKTALEALKIVATPGSEFAQLQVIKHLHHPVVEVRLAAILTLMEIGNRNDPCIIEAICQGLLDRDGQVQDLAATAFGNMVERGHPHAIFSLLLGLSDTSHDKHALRTIIRRLPMVAGCSERSLLLVSNLLEQQCATVRSSVFDNFMRMFDKRYRPCVLAKCACWHAQQAPVPEHSSEDEMKDDRNVQCAGSQLLLTEAPVLSVRVAAQALSACLLQPTVCFPDAVAAAVQRAGGAGDHSVARDLHKCMSSNRWFMRWQTIEHLCRTAFDHKQSLPTCSTTSAKIARPTKRRQDTPKKIRHRSNIENESPDTNHRQDKLEKMGHSLKIEKHEAGYDQGKATQAKKTCRPTPLHRAGCPFAVDSKKAAKRARKTAASPKKRKRSSLGGA